MKEPNAMSFHVKYKPEDFMPANEEEKQSQVIMRESVGFWQDGLYGTGRREHFIYIIFIIRIFVSERNGYILNIFKITLSNSRFCTKTKP